MKVKSLKFNLVAMFSAIYLVGMISVIYYNSYSRKEDEIKAAIANSGLLIDKTGSIKSRIENAFSSLNVLNMNIEATRKWIDREAVNAMLTSIIKKNPDFFGMCTLWEPNGFDGKDKLYANKPGHDSTGRFIPYWCHKPDGSLMLEPLINFDVEGDGDWYLIPKRTKKECLTNPYLYPVGDRIVLMVTVSVPIIKNNEFEALTTVDFDLTFVNDDVLKLQKNIYNGQCNIEMIAANKVFVVNTANLKSIGKPIVNYGVKETDIRFEVLKTRNKQTIIENDSLIICSPIYFAHSPTPWLLRIGIPVSVVTAQSNSAMWKSIWVSLIFLMLGLVLLWNLSSKISIPINLILQNMKTIAKGDFNVEIILDRKDEIGELGLTFNEMSKKIKTTIKHIKESSLVVTDGSQQIAHIAQNVAMGAAVQSTEAEEILASIEEIDAIINQNTENAIQTEHFSKKAVDLMNSVTLKSEATWEAMEQIVAKIAIINQIAQKTDILSINASIEAARAGAMGKGFGIVALEVRNLADLSKKEAREINLLSKKSMVLADESKITIQDMIEKINTMCSLLHNIVESNTDLTMGTEQILLGVNQLSSIIQQNAVAADEMHLNSINLENHSKDLKERVDYFKI